MRRSFPHFLPSLAIALLLSSATAQDRNDPATWEWVVPEEIEGCIHRTVESASMGRAIGYNIYLPPSYETEPEKEFPVIYYLHGAGGGETSAKSFVWPVRGAIRKGDIGEVICVFPNGGERSGYQDWTDGSVMAETWIISELIPHIDATWRTIDEREGRALAGWSMGGGASLRFVMKYPEMFCAAATQAAALEMNIPMAPSDTTRADLERNLDAVRGRTGLWMVVGEEDFLFERNESFSALLKELDVEHTYQTVPDVGHNLGDLSKGYPGQMVRMLSEHLTEARVRESEAE